MGAVMNHPVLITSPVLAPEALAILRGAGAMPHHTGNYPDEAALVAACRAHDPVAILSRQGGVTRAVLDAAPRLRVVARHGVGVDDVDLPACRARGLWVTRAPGSNTRAVAEHAVAMILALAKQLPAQDAEVRAGRWRGRLTQGRDLAGLGLGIAGFGAIGREVARMLAPFGLAIAAWDPLAPVDGTVARVARLANLLPRADILSLHLPLTSETRHLIGPAELALLPRGAVLVNTARGGIVDEDALAAALHAGHLSGAGLDVLEGEPPSPDHKLLRAPRVLLSPHLAGVTPAALVAMGTMAAESIAAVLADRAPQADRVVVRPEQA